MQANTPAVSQRSQSVSLLAASSCWLVYLSWLCAHKLLRGQQADKPPKADACLHTHASTPPSDLRVSKCIFLIFCCCCNVRTLLSIGGAISPFSTHTYFTYKCFANVDANICISFNSAAPRATHYWRHMLGAARLVVEVKANACNKLLLFTCVYTHTLAQRFLVFSLYEYGFIYVCVSFTWRCITNLLHEYRV